MSQYQHLITEEKNGTLIIHINRSEVHNALTKEAKIELLQAIRSAPRLKNIKSIVLTGTGKAFCSGQDLNDRSVMATEEIVDLGHTLETEWNPLIEAITTSELIVIANLNGVCAGAGLSIALACDLLYAHPDAKMISGFTKIALIPDAGSTWNLTRQLGRYRALEFFLFNRPLSAVELRDLHIVSVVDEDSLGLALAAAQQINSMAPLSLKALKKNIRFAGESTYRDSMNRETALQRYLGKSEDYQEGLSAFFEKRSANFQGK